MAIKMPKFSMPKGATESVTKGVGDAAKKIKSNRPINRAFTGVKNAGGQVKEAYNGDVPLTTPFRKSDHIEKMRDSGKGSDYEWGDKSLSWKKIGAATAGAYVAGDTAYRGISGGSLYRNNDGQRDIVGIPII